MGSKSPGIQSSLYCARQFSRRAHSLRLSIEVASRNIIDILDMGNPRECQQNREALANILNEVKSLRFVIAVAEFESPLAAEYVNCLEQVANFLEESIPLIVGRRKEHDSVKGFLAKGNSLLSASILAAEEFISSNENSIVRSTSNTVTNAEVVANILLLSDLHSGQDKSKYPWDRIKENFARDLMYLEDRFIDRWDLVIFSGDLAFSGEQQQFDETDSLLMDQWNRWNSNNWDVRLLACPGNHDLTWQTSSDPTVSKICDYCTDTAVGQLLWGESPDPHYLPAIQKAFSVYSKWWNSKKSWWPKNFVEGRLPGDGSCSFSLNGLRLGVLSLNSSFVQLRRSTSEEEFKGRLAIDGRQARYAVGNGSVTEWAKQQDVNILVSHHPADWIEKKLWRDFEQNIFTADQFHLHLCGHVHVPTAELIKQNGAGPQRRLVCRSLYGREKTANGVETRDFGYAAIQIVRGVDSKYNMRVMPRVAANGLGGRLIPDFHCFNLDFDHPSYGI
jgi:hypothetical protein